MQIVISKERIAEVLTVGEYLDMSEGNFAAMVSAMSKFVVDETGEYMTPEEGTKAVRALTMKQLQETAQTFNKKLMDTTVPNPSASDLEEPSSQEPPPPQAGLPRRKRR